MRRSMGHGEDLLENGIPLGGVPGALGFRIPPFWRGGGEEGMPTGPPMIQDNGDGTVTVPGFMIEGCLSSRVCLDLRTGRWSVPRRRRRRAFFTPTQIAQLHQLRATLSGPEFKELLPALAFASKR